MVFFQGCGGDSAEIMTGDFGFVVTPDDDGIDYICGGCISLALRSADTETRGYDTSVKLGRVETFSRSAALLFDDVNGETHYIPPAITVLVSTCSTNT